ncbi:hypothetical protein C2845_PM07G20280 [Panicum miliaceum]|uniref:Uncharacterized protein n=1 Tax=Panicum miliaceum TaxID=4540 RepID=A0A3L6SIZ8_PANMI|nr:hypothetical protein C2845_PM07G20280 [Panicum miliaceum]
MAMAKLPVCAPCFPPAAVAAAASHSARPISRVSRGRPLGRQGSSPAPIRIQVRERDDAFRFCSQKGADHHTAPEPERDDNDPDAAAGTEIPFIDLVPANSDVPAVQRIRKLHLALAAANAKNKVMALIVCAEAQNALDLASTVMDLTDIASLDMVRSNASIICGVAEDAYKKGIKMDKIPSFLDALRGFGVVCSILVQDTTAMLKDGPLKNSISSDMETQYSEFDKKLNYLKELMVATENKHTVVMDILFDGIKHAQSYISLLIQHRSGAICDLLREKTISMWRLLGET